MSQEVGRCRVCGCTDETPCCVAIEEVGTAPCWWIDARKTLCSNPECLAVVPLEQIERELQQEANAASVG